MEPKTQLTENKKHVKTGEFIFYLMGVFFYTTMTGTVGANRHTYLVNVLKLEESQMSLFNAIVGIVPFILNFFIAMYIDGRKMGKGGKFRPLALLVAVPMGIVMMLTFIAPSGISGTILMVYVLTIAILWSVLCTFGNSINMVAVVMTPNMKERDQVMSFRSIASAVGNSAPMLFLLIIGLIWKDNEGLQYIICAGFCGVIGIITMLLGMNLVRERVTYTKERQNPLIGF